MILTVLSNPLSAQSSPPWRGTMSKFVLVLIHHRKEPDLIQQEGNHIEAERWRRWKFCSIVKHGSEKISTWNRSESGWNESEMKCSDSLTEVQEEFSNGFRPAVRSNNWSITMCYPRVRIHQYPKENKWFQERFWWWSVFLLLQITSFTIVNRVT